jgi:small-conductance mechanosensitive channel
MPAIGSAQQAQPVPIKVQQALDLLADPEVAAWLKANARAPETAPAETVATPSTPWQSVSGWLEQKQANLGRLRDVLPNLPSEVHRVARQLGQDMSGRSFVEMLLLVGAFVGLGLGLEWLYWRATAGLRSRIGQLAEDPLAARGHGAVLRLAFGTGIILSFAAGTVGAFLLFNWPPLVREVVLGYLIAVVFYRVIATVGRLLLASPTPRFPKTERYRLVPVDSATATLWQSRLTRLAGWCGFAAVTMALLDRLGMQPEARSLIGALFMLGVAVIFVELVWRQHSVSRALGPVDTSPTGRWRWLDSKTRAVLLTGLTAVLWLLWVGAFYGAYWLLVLALLVPWLLGIIREVFVHLRRPAADPVPTALAVAPSLLGILIERLIFAIVLVGAGAILIAAFSVNVAGMTSGDTPIVKILRGALQAAVILLVADLVWRLLSAWIDRWLRHTAEDHAPAADMRLARLKTLAPILRNVMLIVVGLVGGMMALSALGIEIGPLIAGAGVAGVAIGFGAQTVVKDVISGIFYLLDDAFRVGEYIQSGSYKGTVESFSLRSVKLRHHRGPLFTVPFSELGAVQNMSRDWVVEKITLGVTYDTNLNKVKQIVKEIGKELADDPEYGPQILQTLKMQGVDAFGDFAIQVRLKIMTKPGDAQFAVKRRAFALIKRAFEQNGIQFAFPTVQVAGGSPEVAAAGQLAATSANSG